MRAAVTEAQIESGKMDDGGGEAKERGTRRKDIVSVLCAYSNVLIVVLFRIEPTSYHFDIKLDLTDTYMD